MKKSFAFSHLFFFSLVFFSLEIIFHQRKVLIFFTGKKFVHRLWVHHTHSTAQICPGSIGCICFCLKNTLGDIVVVKKATPGKAKTTCFLVSAFPMYVFSSPCPGGGRTWLMWLCTGSGECLSIAAFKIVLGCGFFAKTISTVHRRVKFVLRRVKPFSVLLSSKTWEQVFVVKTWTLSLVLPLRRCSQR